MSPDPCHVNVWACDRCYAVLVSLEAHQQRAVLAYLTLRLDQDTVEIQRLIDAICSPEGGASACA